MPRYATKSDTSGQTSYVGKRIQNDSQKTNVVEDKNALYREVQRWLGTPYRFGMAEIGKGTDCSGFVGSIFRTVYGIELPRESNDIYGLGVAITEDQASEGDLVFFQKTYKGAVGASHVGIYMKNGEFVHASTTVGVTFSKLSEPYYANHFLAIRRVLK